jgi:hypothetical protein
MTDTAPPSPSTIFNNLSLTDNRSAELPPSIQSVPNQTNHSNSKQSKKQNKKQSNSGDTNTDQKQSKPKGSKKPSVTERLARAMEELARQKAAYEKMIADKEAQRKQTADELQKTQVRLELTRNPFGYKTPEVEATNYTQMQDRFQMLHDAAIHVASYTFDEMGMAQDPRFVLPKLPTSGGVKSMESAANTMFREKWQGPLSQFIDRTLPLLKEACVDLARRRYAIKATTNKVDIMTRARAKREEARQKKSRQRNADQKRDLAADEDFAKVVDYFAEGAPDEKGAEMGDEPADGEDLGSESEDAADAQMEADAALAEGADQPADEGADQPADEGADEEQVCADAD